MNTIERARGRWREILPQLGIEPRFLVNRHGPCPLCGGRDRFRFDDKDGSGSYYCNQCGPGPGIMLIRKLHGWDHRTACDEIDKILGVGPIEPSPAVSSNGSPNHRRAKLERVIAEATSAEVVERYLGSRGLHVVPDVLRGHGGLAYHDGDQFVGRFPAVVAPVIGPDGSLQSVHRIYVSDAVETRKKLMPPVDTINGAAVRLFDVGDRMGVAEGIETAIACTEYFGIPTWAALSANGIEAFEPPESIKNLVVFGDNYVSFTGQKAAFTLAHRIVRDRKEVDVEVSIPPSPGTDWLDVLNETRRP